MSNMQPHNQRGGTMVVRRSSGASDSLMDLETLTLACRRAAQRSIRVRGFPPSDPGTSEDQAR